MRRLVGFDSAALLLVDPTAPDPSAVLDAKGLTGAQVGGWADAGAKSDALLRRAAKSGQTRTDKPLAEPNAGLPQGLYAAVAASRCAPGEKHYWALALGRKKKAYTDADLAGAELALGAIRRRFDATPTNDAGLERVLVSPDGRVMHVDLETRLSLGGPAESVQSVVDTVLAIEAQRWPDASAKEVHDVFPPVPKGRPVWARVSRLPGWGRGRPGAVSIELRPIHGLAPPPMGLLGDERIAQAVGQLTQEYAAAPPLAELAKRFDLSLFHFHRVFMEAAGISPKQLVLRVQLLHARHQLRTTLDPIRHVAADQGFASHGHFSHTFHRRVGITPIDYRLGVQPPEPEPE